MERAAAEWRYDELHSDAPYHDGTFPQDRGAWSPHRTTETPYHYKDGVNIWVAQYDRAPEDKFLGVRNADEDD